MRLPVLAAVLMVFSSARAQDRIRFNNQDLFLSGGNVAWVNFARDVGPGATDLARFDRIFREVHESGGNAMRLWLHTTGASTPEWVGDRVVGPGIGAVEDLRSILDLAWEHEIGLQLCLWSFDMLRISNGPGVTDRAFTLLSEPEALQAYVDRALIPMVEALASHPAIIAWEIFNEAEGMSDEFGWDFNRHVPMAFIQQFVNVTAGAIHRTDSGAQVTNGIWSFMAMDYYTDEALVSAGGDPQGTLDFYNVHYYEWGGTTLSPFHHTAFEWGVDKPLVVGEFFMGEGADGDPDRSFGIHHTDFFRVLVEGGYAGALGWQWYNHPVSAEGVVNWPRMLENMRTLCREYPDAVDILPVVTTCAPEVPAGFGLAQNYPNPFRNSTVIAFDLPEDVFVRLAVYDALGRLVRVLEDGPRAAGGHEIVFDAAGLASGVYVYRLETNAFTDSKAMLLVR